MTFSFLSWDKYPFFRYVLFLILGLWLANEFPVQVPISLQAIFFSCGILLLMVLQRNNFYGYIALFFIGACGYLSGNKQEIPRKPAIHQAFIGTIESFVEKTTKGVKVIINVEQTLNNSPNNISHTFLKANVFINAQGQDSNLNYGDRIKIKGVLKEIQPPENPEAFDNKKYQNQKNIYYQSYSEEYELINKGNQFHIFNIAEKTRSYCDHIFKQYVKGKNEYAIVTAMLLGIRSQLDYSIKEAYSNAGIIHIIAISGLHISLFFVLFNGLISKIVKSPLIVIVTVLLFIWFYGIVTGLTASVVRAVLMHTVMLTGQLFQRKTNFFNNTCFSAFVLLLINPNYLLDIGFQLSYLAVTGLALFEMYFPNKMVFRYNIVNTIFEIIRVTLIAQLATFPILLFYFHKISFGFLLANLLVIPLSTFIIWQSIALLCTSLLHISITSKLGILLTFSTSIMNFIALKIGTIANATIENISYSSIECIFMYSLIIVILIYFKHPQKQYFWLSLVLMIFLFGLRSLFYYSGNHQHLLVIYAFKNNSVVCVINGHTCKTYCQNTPSIYDLKTIQNLYVKRQITTIKQVKLISTFQNTGFIPLHQSSLLIINSPEVPIFKQKIEYLQIINNAKFNWQTPVEFYPTSTIIIDKSNTWKYAHQLENFLLLRNLKVHNMYKQGAFTIDLSQYFTKNAIQ